MANTFRKIYKKTGNNGNDSDYQLIANVGVNGIDLDIMKGATSSANGEIGLVPKPTAGQQNYVLTGGATWKDIDSILLDAISNSKLTALNTSYQKFTYNNVYCQHDNQVYGTYYTIPKTGIYLVWGISENNTASTTGFTELSIAESGVGYYQLETCTHIGVPVIPAGMIIRKFSKNAKISLRLYQNSGYGETISRREMIILKLV